MKITHRPVTDRDVPAIMEMTLSDADVAELKAAWNQTPQEAIALSLQCCDEPWVVLLDDRVVAIYGVSAAPEYAFGIPWFLSTGDIGKIAKSFLKGSREVILRFHEEFEALSNVVDSRHEVAIRWLKWLGFDFLPEPLTFHDPTVPFYQFVRYSPCATPH